MTPPPVVERRSRRMFMRDGHVIDVSGMTPEDLWQFVGELERLNREGVRLANGIEFIVEGETFPKGHRIES